jgi:hypothetical protein
MAKEKWNKPVDGIIHVPDELDPLVNSIAVQFRFYQISGKSDNQTICDIAYMAQQFFKKHPELLNIES